MRKIFKNKILISLCYYYKKTKLTEKTNNFTQKNELFYFIYFLKMSILKIHQNLDFVSNQKYKQPEI